MFKKKSMGLHWLILLLAFFMGIGTVLFLTFNQNLPKVGEASTDVIKSIEKNSNILSTVDGVMKWIEKKTMGQFDRHPVFKLDSYCENPYYKSSLYGKNFAPPPSLSGRKEVSCFVGETELGNYYLEVFDRAYTDFKLKKFENFILDFSNINYIYSIKKENDIFFVEGKTQNKLNIPIMKNKPVAKKTGDFFLNPSFKINANYDFSNRKKEVCIFSSDCGATCYDVLEKYPNKGYVIRENAIPSEGCRAYYDCETPLDQFGKTFPCPRKSTEQSNNPILCKGTCTPYCSGDSSKRVLDNDEQSTCAQYSCWGYMSCQGISTCSCPAPESQWLGNQCTGSDCKNLDCNKDTELETKTGISTKCKPEACSYYDNAGGRSCASTNLCKCNSENACQGDCTCEEERRNIGCTSECGTSDTWEVTYPYGCKKDSYRYCGECNKQCGPCGCKLGCAGECQAYNDEFACTTVFDASCCTIIS